MSESHSLFRQRGLPLGLTVSAFALIAAVWSASPSPAQGDGAVSEAKKMNAVNTQTAVLAGGCFWCVEADFDKLPGVLDVVSGYSGGTSQSPTYGDYAAGGHREVVQVTYDPSQVTYAGLVEWLIKHMDPTDANGSFYDRGREYAPGIYYETPDQKADAERVIAEIDAMKVYDQKIATDVLPRTKFWPAEAHHQDYHTRHGFQYNIYRHQSGRDAFVKKAWGDRAKRLELAGSTPVN